MAAEDRKRIVTTAEPEPFAPRTAAAADAGLGQDRHARRHGSGARRIRVPRAGAEPAEPRAATARRTNGPAGNRVPDALDAAAFLALVPRPMSWLKMQDLLYFAQAWHLVWDDEPLFPDPILAVERGVLITALEDQLAGNFGVGPGALRKAARADRLDESRKRTLSGIVKYYADRSHYRLAEQIRSEEPWLQARRGPGGEGMIDLDTLRRFYRELD